MAYYPEWLSSDTSSRSNEVCQIELIFYLTEVDKKLLMIIWQEKYLHVSTFMCFLSSSYLGKWSNYI